MARKPVHLELTGDKTPRQRIWEALRRQRNGFYSDKVAVASKVPASTVRDYIKSLLTAGYIEVTDEQCLGGAAVRRCYRLIRDNGVDAPCVTRQGVEVAQGIGNEAMWSTMRRLFVTRDFNSIELAAFASSQSHAISSETAASYIGKLAKAGYLECVAPSKSTRGGKTLARYRLRKCMESGPKAPWVQRTRFVFDPNWNRVVWLEHQEASDE
ncbi:MAG: hypothetical protein VB141_12105 [Burkholderia gladioli]